MHKRYNGNSNEVTILLHVPIGIYFNSCIFLFLLGKELKIYFFIAVLPKNLRFFWFYKLQCLTLINMISLTNSVTFYSGYTLTYMKAGHVITMVTQEVGATTLNYTITGLTATTTYTIEVYARTRVGPGQPRSANIDSGIPPGRW